MRLLKLDDNLGFVLTPNLTTEELPPYAILSHTWSSCEEEEVTFNDLQNGCAQSKAGLEKIKFCAAQTRKDNIDYFWIDTCCIDRSNRPEIQEAIFSMYQWYKNSQKCYVYLSDVSTNPSMPSWNVQFQRSRWFTRGWTLQELLAPKVVEFFSMEGKLLGTRLNLLITIHEITGIPIAALNATSPSEFTISERLRWGMGRQTREREDQVYCYLGLLEISMPVYYGEGDEASPHLRRRIAEHSSPNMLVASLGSTHSSGLGLCLDLAPKSDYAPLVGRLNELDKIHRILQPSSTAPEQRFVVIEGIAGVGKTHLAVGYAQCYRNTYSSVLWFNATSKSSMFASLRHICKLFVRAEDLAQLDREQMLLRLQAWLCDPENTHSLVIFDGYKPYDAVDLAEFCPSGSLASVIVTTRHPGSSAGFRLDLRCLEDIEESLNILQVYSDREVLRQDSDSRHLAESLHGLPLALVVAARLLRNSTLSCGEYLDLFGQNFNQNSSLPRSPTGPLEFILRTTFALTYAHLNAEDKPAVELLDFLIYFSAQDIRCDLLRAGLNNVSPGRVRQIVEDSAELQRLIEMLAEYGLLDYQSATNSFSMSGYFQRYAEFDKLCDREYFSYSLACITESLAKISLTDERETWHMRICVHACDLVSSPYRLARLLATSGPSLEDLTRMLEVAVFLQEQAQYLTAERLLDDILTYRELLLGQCDYNTMCIATVRVICYIHQARFHDAEVHFTQVLNAYKAYRRSLRTDDRDLDDVSRNRLHVSLKDLLQSVVSRSEALYGSEHFSTHELARHLETTYIELRQLPESRASVQKPSVVVDLCRRPNRIHSVGSIFYYRGQYKNAVQIFLRALREYEAMDRSPYKKVLSLLVKLQWLFEKQEMKREAQEICKKALQITYDDEDSARISYNYCTLISRLGDYYKQRGKTRRAKRMYRQGLPGYKKAVESIGYCNIEIADRLIHIYGSLGMFKEAEKVKSRVGHRFPNFKFSDSSSAHVRRQEWTCRTCACHNPLKDVECGMCGTKRPMCISVTSTEPQQPPTPVPHGRNYCKFGAACKQLFGRTVTWTRRDNVNEGLQAGKV